MIIEAIGKVVEGEDLSLAEAEKVMNEILSGTSTSAQIASFLTALRIKGETIEEITGFAQVMREKAVTINSSKPVIIDTCGTGGDAKGTFNISTASALVVSGSGLTVAKHGNRSVSSLCGSADVLEAIGVKIDITPAQMEACLKEIGIAFLFAPALHSAMKHAIGPRKEIGIRTVFNVLGPLTNPAKANVQVLGVFDSSLTEKIAGVLSELGSERALVVHGADGLDELSTTGENIITEIKDGQLMTYKLNPEDFGFKKARLEDLKGNDPENNAMIINQIFMGEPGPKRDIVVLNAGAAIYAAGLTKDIKVGFKRAAETIDGGHALNKLNELKKFTNNVNSIKN